MIGNEYKIFFVQNFNLFGDKCVFDVVVMFGKGLFCIVDFVVLFGIVIVNFEVEVIFFVLL